MIFDNRDNPYNKLYFSSTLTKEDEMEVVMYKSNFTVSHFLTKKEIKVLIDHLQQLVKQMWISAREFQARIERAIERAKVDGYSIAKKETELQEGCEHEWYKWGDMIDTEDVKGGVQFRKCKKCNKMQRHVVA